MQKGRRYLASHALTERELSQRHVEQRSNLHALDEFVEVSRKGFAWHAIDIAEQFEALDYGQIPPQLGPLAEDHSDACDVPDSLVPGYEPIDLASSGRRAQNPRKNLDQG